MYLNTNIYTVRLVLYITHECKNKTFLIEIFIEFYLLVK